MRGFAWESVLMVTGVWGGNKLVPAEGRSSDPGRLYGIEGKPPRDPTEGAEPGMVWTRGQATRLKVFLERSVHSIVEALRPLPVS